MEILGFKRLPDVISTFSLVTFLLVCSVPKGECQLGPPPTLHIDRNWRIQEDHPVGTLVKHAQAISPTGTEQLSFTIQPSEHNTDLSTFFRIDSKTGGIFLTKSLKGKHSSRGYMYIAVRTVTEDDAPSIPTRVEVMVQIDPPLSASGGSPNITGRPPSYSNIPFGTFYPPQSMPFPPQDQGTSKTSLTTDGPFLDVTNNVSPAINVTDNEDSNNVTVTMDLQPLKPQNSTKNDYVTGTPATDTSQSDGTSGEVEAADDLSREQIRKDSASSKTMNVKEGQNKADNTNTITLVTVIPIVVIFALVPIVLVIFWVLKKRSKINKRPTKEIRKESAITTASNVTMSSEGESPSALQHWYGKRAQSNRYESSDPDSVLPQVQNRWEFPRHHLQIGGILGEGCFGQVWRCEALNIDGKEGTTTVAVKTLKESAGERERADLLSELAVMKMLDPHPNVVRLLGSCTEKDPIFLIMEYVALGKLQTYLRNSRAQHYYGNLHGDSSSLSSKDLTSFAHQVARGMEYLASKGIIHRDLAARNILIDKERVCKVADFGFARDVVVNHVYERKSDGRLPIRWMAPEALYDNIFTTKTDVWSFGVLMWEIVTLGSTPYPGMAAGEVMRKVRDGYRLEKPEHCRRELYNIMFYCWAHNPDDRPTFAELVNFLRHLLFSETDYIELDRFPDHDYYNMTSLSGEKL